MESPGNMSEMQVLWPTPTCWSTDSELGPSNLGVKKPCRWPWPLRKCEDHCRNHCSHSFCFLFPTPSPGPSGRRIKTFVCWWILLFALRSARLFLDFPVWDAKSSHRRTGHFSRCTSSSMLFSTLYQYLPLLSFFALSSFPTPSYVAEANYESLYKYDQCLIYPGFLHPPSSLLYFIVLCLHY